MRKCLKCGELLRACACPGLYCPKCDGSCAKGDLPSYGAAIKMLADEKENKD